VKTRHTTNTAIKLQIITDFWHNDLHDTRTCRGIKRSNINKTEISRSSVALEVILKLFIYKHYRVHNNKKIQKRDLNMGDPVVLRYKRLRMFKSRHMQLYHKHGLLQEPHICWAHIAECSLNIYRWEKDSEQNMLDKMKHIPLSDN
jgi:hypothetical protein